MDNLLPENEYTEVEGRAYVNPQVGIDESNTFIDNLRATQGQQNQEIFTDTQRLGTDVPSDIGGLTGANSYFTSRYQTPMTNAAIGSLRATAQAAALNQVLANEQAIWKKKYQDAYRNYQKRNYNRARYGNSRGSGGGSSGGGDTGNTSTWNGDIEDEVITNSGKTIQGAVPGVVGGYVVGNVLPDEGIVTGYTGVPYGEDYKTNYVYNYSDGAPKSMNLSTGSSTIFSGDKNKYLGTGGRL